MNDGDTTDTTSTQTTQTNDLDAKIKLVEAERAKLEAQNKKLETQIKGVESLVAKWGGEMGKGRKDIDDALTNIKSAAEVTDAKKILDRIAEIEKIVTSKLKGGESTQVDQHNSEEKTLKELKASLSAEQKKKADEVFKGLPVEQKENLLRDENSMKKFLLAAAEIKLPTSVPDSLFGEEEQPKTANEWRRAFGLVSTEENFVPAGKRGQAPRGFVSGQENQEQVVKRLPGGVIPRPREMKPT